MHKDTRPVECIGRAGDIVFWHHRLAHMAGHNFTPGHLRQAILYDFATERLDELRMRLETETWQCLPLQRGWKLVDIKELRHNWRDGQQGRLQARKKALSPRPPAALAALALQSLRSPRS